jgi:pyridinium-3,5-biscarboxylic acid mononucleotide synthase
MKADRVLELLQQVASGESSPREALERLSWLPVESVNGEDAMASPYARLDHHRSVRSGFPEVVYCPGKTVGQVLEICGRLAERDGGFLATRADDAQRAAFEAGFPAADINEVARTVWLAPADSSEPTDGHTIVIATAGTADIPVAEEAAVTATAFGNTVERVYDIGVAGLHRVLGASETLSRASVIVVVAGMDGALPSVVGGLVACPVIAVPTSSGYGASFGGIAALLTMLNSCAAGVTVVNIDNGFGAACAASRILHQRKRVARD